jgi:hypothetical protein
LTLRSTVPPSSWSRAIYYGGRLEPEGGGVVSEQVSWFRIETDQTMLDDLRDRLRRTRWPEQETVPDWTQGVPLGYVQELCRYWAQGYDWRATEARLNSLPQFRTEIDGLGILAWVDR